MVWWDGFSAIFAVIDGLTLATRALEDSRGFYKIPGALTGKKLSLSMKFQFDSLGGTVCSHFLLI